MAEYYSMSASLYSCNACGKEFASQPLVSQHYRFVHLKRRRRERQCPKCDEKVPGYLKAHHMETAHGIPAPTCGICAKKFRFPCDLLKHQKKVHMMERTVSCEVCGKAFFNDTSLKVHMATHSIEKKYKCQLCEKSFRWVNNLKDHLKIHTGDKRYVCSVCAMAFVQKTSLKKHCSRNHPGVAVK